MTFIRDILTYWNYYDEPEGKDPVNKVVGLAKYGLLVGAPIAITDACLYSKCLNAFEFLNTAGYWIVPLTGMCVAFSAVTYTATNLRKKDDKLNYVLGALASGGVLHAWLRKPVYSGPGTAFLVLSAVLKKDTKQHNYTKPHKNVLLPDEVPDKWYFPWRNVYYRDYYTNARFEHNKVDYYTNPSRRYL